MKIRFLVGVGSLLVVSAGIVLGQQRFSDMIAVTEVEVPVRVLVKGKPLAGLTRDDFELYESGVQQTIVGFEVRNQWEAVEREQIVPTPAVEGTDPASRRLLLLFDFTFSRRQRLARALRDIRGSLDRQLSPTDRVAVATYGRVSGLNLLVGFTEDRNKTALAFDAVQAMLDAKRQRQREALAQLHDMRFRDASGEGGSSTYQTLAEELSPAAALAVLAGPVAYDEAEDDGVVVQEQESYFGPIQVRVEVDVTQPINTAQDEVSSDVGVSTVRSLGLSLAELAFLLKDAGGQKDMLLISEGFGGGLLQDARSLFYLQKALRAFRDSGWTLHGIDARGVPGIDERGFASDSLFFMADATGGDLIENVNDFSVATSRVLERTSIVYVLTFQPQSEGDEGEFHPLEVKLSDPPKGAKIVHRPGYYTRGGPSEREVFEQRVDAAGWLLTNLEAAELDVQVYAQSAQDPLGGTRVPVAVEVGGRSLLETGTKKPSRLELQLVALDSEARVREILNAEEKMDFPALAETLNRGGVRFVGELGLAPGSYQLRVLVRSHRKGEVFLATYPLSVGAGATNELSPPPPPEERPADSWVMISAQRRASYFQ